MKGLDVKKILKENGITLVSVARKLEISPQHLNNILNSDNIKSGWLQKIQNVTGIRFIINEESNIRFRISDDEFDNCINCIEKQREIDFLKKELEKNSDYIELLKDQLNKVKNELTKYENESGEVKPDHGREKPDSA